MDKDKDMSRRRFLKMAALTGAAMCVGPTLNKVTAAERVWMGKQQVANNIPAGMAAVRTRRTLGHGNTAFTVSAMGYGCMGLNHNRSQYPSREKDCLLSFLSTYRGLAVYPCALFVTYCFYFSRNTVVHNLSLLFTAAKIEKSGNKCISEADFCQVRETAYLR